MAEIGTTTQNDSGRLCVFCRERPGTERGHVVAKCFYAIQPAENFPRVPACKECEVGKIDGTNWRVNDDEEYMAYIVQLMIESEDHPEAKELTKSTGKVMHTLRGKHRRVRDAIAKSVQYVDLVNEYGVVIPNGAVSFSYDMSCFERVIKKITKALYYVNNKFTPLPLDHHVEVAPRLHPTQVPAVVDEVMRQEKKRRVGPYTLGQNEVFSYLGVQIPDDYHHQRYLMRFYRHYFVLADTVRNRSAR